MLELGLGLAGIADDEGRAQDELGAVGAPAGDLVEGARARRRGGPCASAPRGGCAGRGCRGRAGPPLGHQRDQLADVRVGVDVVQAHPGAERAELAGEVGDVACGPRGPATDGRRGGGRAP